MQRLLDRFGNLPLLVIQHIVIDISSLLAYLQNPEGSRLNK